MGHLIVTRMVMKAKGKQGWLRHGVEWDTAASKMFLCFIYDKFLSTKYDN